MNLLPALEILEPAQPFVLALETERIVDLNVDSFGDRIGFVDSASVRGGEVTLFECRIL